MQNSSSIDVSVESFQSEVVDRSQSLPVVLLFWAEQVPPSVQAKQQLEAMLGQYQGKFVLALSDVWDLAVYLNATSIYNPRSVGSKTGLMDLAPASSASCRISIWGLPTASHFSNSASAAFWSLESLTVLRSLSGLR